MTTSALIWVNGSIGVAVGLGQYFLAVVSLVLAITALRLLGLFEQRMKIKCRIAHYVVRTDGSEKATELVRKALETSHHEEGGLSFYRDRETLTLKFGFCNSPSQHQEFIERLQLLPEVLSVESQV